MDNQDNKPALFSNAPVGIDTLPKAEMTVGISLEPTYKTVRYIGAAIFGLLLITVTFGFIVFKPDLGFIRLVLLGFVFLVAIWNYLYHGISFKYMSYMVREKDISYQSGWLWKSMTTVPFNRVQHCDIRQGVLDRQFGLAKLTIYTAGGQSTDLEIPGLTPETAEKLKSFVLNATEQSVENKA